MAFPRFRSLRYILRTKKKNLWLRFHQHRKEFCFLIYIILCCQARKGHTKIATPWVAEVSSRMKSAPSRESFFPSGPWIKGRWAKSGMVQPLGSKKCPATHKGSSEGRETMNIVKGSQPFWWSFCQSLIVMRLFFIPINLSITIIIVATNYITEWH